MRLLIQHHSRYTYAQPAHLGAHTLRLRPAAHTRARVETYRLQIDAEHRLRWQQDPYGNHIARVHFPEETPLAVLDLRVELVVDVRPVNPFDFLLEPLAERIPFEYPPELARELSPFRSLDDPAFACGERFDALDAELPRSGETLPLLTALNSAVNARVKYVIREEMGVFTPEESLAAGRASCRDSAVLLAALMRRRGLAARFCSGYLIQLTDEGMLPDQPKGVSRDVVDLHAWCEVYLPGAGWVGLDATSGLLCGEGHIPLCGASTPALASPLEGTSDTPATEVDFRMVVERLGHETQPTTPYSEGVFEALLAAGVVADARLQARGVRLTVGGEPTFNARTDVDAPEWNGAALGPTKLETGRALAGALRERLAPGAAILHRQGKWYPGESLPRWALEIVARRGGTDGIAWGQVGASLWPDRPSPAVAPKESDALAFITHLAARLGVELGVTPAFEDPLAVIRDEASVPADVDARRAELDAPEGRARLARVLSRGVSTPAGHVLPLGPAPDGGFCTEVWRFRRGALHLLPGDSPIGLRLPLAALPTAPPPPRFVELMPPPETPTDPRRSPEDLEAEESHRGFVPTNGRQVAGVRTALCVEVRDGALFVFLPPMPTFGRWSALLTAVDATRTALGLDVRLGGYGPPPDAGVLKFSVTPDPGVLEVNVPPTASLAEYDALAGLVFEAALHTGLHSEKYLIDGRLSGSGGGHHITMGGPTPLESPFIRRPDLLASLLTFVQHHPALSYLFAGLFVGPTSQAPRADEARHESLYELEIALERAFRRDEDDDTPPPPWLGDILFRHMLVDLTGNTHRAEISIDKLFDPQTPHGRQGLVEMRAFEMPPHPRMMTAQVALMRGLIAAFVDEPYQHPLVRWGMSLHDRFMLPYFLGRDLEDILAFLRDRGLALPTEAYSPFLDLRCPLVGTLQAGDVSVELRNALEPWHVLGEEQTAGGTSRFVDSSVERLEVRVSGLDGLEGGRHVVLVNGYTLPLAPTGVSGQRVAGVRFRAWAPPHSLHAHIGVQHPVRVEVVDTWARRSLGGCAYHVWHPEGRAFDAPPLTRFEAAARRAQRFTRDEHTPWPVTPKPAACHPDAPLTLDLRRLPGSAPESV